jgi:hypothetical protein
MVCFFWREISVAEAHNQKFIKRRSMKTLNLLAFALLTLAIPAQSQFLLNEGDTYVFEFATLPFVQTEDANDPFKSDPIGLFRVITPLIPPSPLVQYRLEMFENSLLEIPLATVLRDSSAGVSSDMILIADGAWRDLQGAVRVTAVSGSFQLDAILVGSFLPQPDGSVNDYFVSVTPVPEPSTLSFFGVALLGGLFWKMAWRKTTTNDAARS